MFFCTDSGVQGRGYSSTIYFQWLENPDFKGSLNPTGYSGNTSISWSNSYATANFVVVGSIVFMKGLGSYANNVHGIFASAIEFLPYDSSAQSKDELAIWLFDGLQVAYIRSQGYGNNNITTYPSGPSSVTISAQASPTNAKNYAVASTVDMGARNASVVSRIHYTNATSTTVFNTTQDTFAVPGYTCHMPLSGSGLCYRIPKDGSNYTWESTKQVIVNDTYNPLRSLPDGGGAFEMPSSFWLQ